MLPLLAIGGVIGAVMSIGKGASWLADQLAPTNEAGASADKSTAKPQTAMSSAFETALAAQAAGQTVPGAGNIAPTPTTTPSTVAAPGGIIQLAHGTDYDVQARIQAGIAAYGNIGDRHGQHGGAAKPQGTGDDATPPPANWNATGHKASVISAS